MRVSTPLVLLATLATSAWAFPSQMRAASGRISLDSRLVTEEALENAKRLSQAWHNANGANAKRADSGKPTLTPDPKDKEHRFIAPGPTDQRGPCPGMNTLANHGYVPRNGIVTLADLVDGQQKLFNIDPTLGAVLALVATALDGDILTMKLSLGAKDSRTMALGAVQGLLSDEPGLDGHDRFEADTSLTREDFYLADGNNWEFSPRLYKKMHDFVHQKKYGGKYNFDSMADLRDLRYAESRKDNDRFYFGPKSLLLFGAASFVYEAFGNATESNDYATERQVASFFGAVKDKSAPHGYRYQPERVPPNWYRRADPYTLKSIGGQLFSMYGKYKRPFGANGKGDDKFFVFDSPFVNTHIPKNPQEVVDYCCPLFALLEDNLPGQIATPFNYLQSQLDFLLGAAQPAFKDSCNCGGVKETLSDYDSSKNVNLQKDVSGLIQAILPKPGKEAKAAGKKAWDSLFGSK